MNISKGKQNRPVRALVYGPEGVGKSLFAAKWPAPLFVDCENGTRLLDVERTERPASWSMLKFIVEELSKESYVNIMAQYRPCFKAHEYEELNRRPSSIEYSQVLDFARKLGLHRGFSSNTCLNEL